MKETEVWEERRSTEMCLSFLLLSALLFRIIADFIAGFDLKTLVAFYLAF